MGYVADFVMWAAKTSSLLAHQLLWNMQTNVYRDEEGTVKDGKQFYLSYSTGLIWLIAALQPRETLFHKIFTEDIGEEMELLMTRIKESFSGPARRFYEREFDFFGKITAISGTIK